MEAIIKIRLSVCLAVSLTVKHRTRFKDETHLKKKNQQLSPTLNNVIKKHARTHIQKHNTKESPKVLPLERVPVTSDTSSYFPIFAVFHLNFHSVS